MAQDSWLTGRRSSTAEHRDKPADRSHPLRGRISEPVGRRQPHEGEYGDDHRVVLPRGALVGPEERVPENAAGKSGGGLHATAPRGRGRSREGWVTPPATAEDDDTTSNPHPT